eukprot:2069206-Ditylum_brightwellii.AAC.1
MFAYLKKHPRSRLVFDDSEPDYTGIDFYHCDWSEYYPDAAEVLPKKMPKPRGYKATRRLYTAIILMVNRSPILWYSKQQNTVESSTFCSKFVALKTATDVIKGLCYKLCMMGAPIDGTTCVFCDNNLVVKNVSNQESMIKKQHTSITYYRVCEAIASGIMMVTSKPGVTNLSDLACGKYLEGQLDGPGQEGDQVPGTGIPQIVRSVM